MGLFKKIILWFSVAVGLLGVAADSHKFGTQAGIELLAVYFLTTAFLWHWASGALPQIGKFGAAVLMMVSALLAMLIINYALSDQIHVDLTEVLRVSLQHKPWFYGLLLLVACIKVLFWHWLFADVRNKKAAAAIAA